MPRSSRIRSAVGVVGSFAPSTTTLQSTVLAFASLVITPPRAAGTNHSQGIVQSSSVVMRLPPFHSETGFPCATWARSPGISSPLSLYIPPDTSLTATTVVPASLLRRRARWLPTLPKPWITTRPPLIGIPKSRAYSCITYITPRPVASSRPSDPPKAIGFPVTTAGLYPWRLEYSSRIQAITCALVLTSGAGIDRKSTRLNSSHVRISYAVFCLKKKKHGLHHLTVAKLQLTLYLMQRAYIESYYVFYVLD